MSKPRQIISFIAIAFLAIGCGPRTPLGMAVYNDNLQEMKTLLANGADPCEPAGNGSYTALDLAAGDAHDLLKRNALKEDYFKALLDTAYKRVLDGKKCEGLLFHAARVGDKEKAQKLITLGEDPNQGEDMWETSPLGIAAFYGHGEAVCALITGGARKDPQIENFDKMRLWAITIGRNTSYQQAQAALGLLKKCQTEKQ